MRSAARRGGGEPGRKERLRRLVLSNAVARFNRNTTTGAITQPAGTAGCVSETGRGPAPTAMRSTARPVAVSPDGKSVYVASYDSDAVARLNRNTTTGAITQPAGTAGCISETGAGPCADGHGLDGPRSVAVSPDGKSVYVASPDSNAVARLNRNTTTGAITQPAGSRRLRQRDGAGPCADGHGLTARTGWRSAPDGKSVYVASFGSKAVARLNRNTTTGAITQPAGTAGCVSETGAGPCADGHGLNGRVLGGGQRGREERLRRLARGSDAVARFNRNTTTGAISPARRDRRLRQRDGGGALRRRPWARRRVRRWR